jgi:opacity protein-like surface antigen
MKYVMKKVLIAGAMVAASSTISACDDMSFTVGADYQQTFMKSKSAVRLAGRDRDFSAVNPKSFPGANFYVGAKFHENLGVELGYNFMSKKRDTTTAGVKVSQKLKSSGGYVDANGYFPVADGLDVIGSVGFGFIKIKLFGDVFSTSSTSANTKNNVLPRVGIGAQYMVCDTFGVRAMARWQGTAAVYYKDAVNGNKVKPFKSATSLAFGVFAKF